MHKTANTCKGVRFPHPRSTNTCRIFCNLPLPTPANTCQSGLMESTKAFSMSTLLMHCSAYWKLTFVGIITNWNYQHNGMEIEAYLNTDARALSVSTNDLRAIYCQTCHSWVGIWMPTFSDSQEHLSFGRQILKSTESFFKLNGIGRRLKDIASEEPRAHRSEGFI